MRRRVRQALLEEAARSDVERCMCAAVCVLMMMIHLVM
jgi:hypothetical protein